MDFLKYSGMLLYVMEYWYHLMGLVWLLFQTEECSLLVKEHIVNNQKLDRVSQEKKAVILGKGRFPNKPNLDLTRIFSYSGT